MNLSGKDNEYMRRCFQLAAYGKGKVSPNPLVGAVLVKDGEIIGEGWHEEYGGPHAEANAIKNCKVDVKGSSLYCNLEPCCHTDKKTPPCTPLIIRSGIKHVVISNSDPNPEVSGRGIAELKRAGITVVTGVLEKEGEYLNRFYLKRTRTNLPFVTLKIAQSSDGKITGRIGAQSRITGRESEIFVHRQRAEYDAVLIGANTVQIDNPQLNVRAVKGRNPIRVIVDGKLTSPAYANVFSDGEQKKTWLLTGENTDQGRIMLLRNKGVNFFQLPVDKSGYISVEEILKLLGKQKINSLLVEGGKEIFTQFIKSGYFDDVVILQAPIFLGRGLNSVEMEGVVDLETGFVEKLGRDLKIELKNKNSKFFYM